MARYIKTSPRLTVTIYDENSKEIGKISNRNHLDIGELFSDNTFNSIINGLEIEDDNVTLVVMADFKKVG